MNAPPPPPHGSNGNSRNGLPDGSYDIFIVPPHSSGGGFIYFPSLQTNRNSFLAGVVSALFGVMVWSIVLPVFREWMSDIAAGGGLSVIILLLAVGVAGWAWGKTQIESGGSGQGSAGAAHRPQSAGHAGNNGPEPGSTPQPESRPPPSWQRTNPGTASGTANTGAASGTANTGAARGTASTGTSNGTNNTGTARGTTNTGATSGTSNTGTERGTNTTGAAKGGWEKAREETRKKEEERRRAEELKKKREEDERERVRQREKEARERQARERREKEAARNPRPASPNKNHRHPTAKTATDDASSYSYRPYDSPERPRHKPASASASSIYSETSYTPSQSTSRTTPPPSHRGPYRNKDPDKIVIKAVYSFNNAFTKTPIAKLVSSMRSVTDGLILRITTEGLFIDDDVRGVPQREWDVKAWTLKLVEVCCYHSLTFGADSGSNSSSRVAVT